MLYLNCSQQVDNMRGCFDVIQLAFSAIDETGKNYTCKAANIIGSFGVQFALVD